MAETEKWPGLLTNNFSYQGSSIRLKFMQPASVYYLASALVLSERSGHERSALRDYSQVPVRTPDAHLASSLSGLCAAAAA